MTGQSPAQASVAPSPLHQEPQVPQPSMGAPYAPIHEKPDSNKSSIRFPVVKLGRLSVSFVFFDFVPGVSLATCILSKKLYQLVTLCIVSL